MYNIRFIKESQWPSPSFKYLIVYKTIVKHNSETIVKFEPKSYCQYHLSSSVHN